MQPVERKLAAIFAADIAGYTRLMARDEVGTLARLKTLRADLVDPSIAAHNGDGLLIGLVVHNRRPVWQADPDARANSGVSQSPPRTSPRVDQERRDFRRLFQRNRRGAVVLLCLPRLPTYSSSLTRR